MISCFQIRMIWVEKVGLGSLFFFLLNRGSTTSGMIFFYVPSFPQKGKEKISWQQNSDLMTFKTASPLKPYTEIYYVLKMGHEQASGI